MLNCVVFVARKSPFIGNRVVDFGKQGFHLSALRGSVKGEIYQKQPVKTFLEKGKTYKWCACGLSCKQPFCDGSHKDSKKGIKGGIQFSPQTSKDYHLCMCKQTNQRPFCDGTHKSC